MSEKHPECPLYNPLNCKEYYNPKLCAFVRRDKACLKKKKCPLYNPLNCKEYYNPKLCAFVRRDKACLKKKKPKIKERSRA
jgi:hypothetical protein